MTETTYNIDTDIVNTMSKILESGKANGASALLQTPEGYKLKLTVKRTQVELELSKAETILYLKGVAHGLGLDILS